MANKLYDEASVHAIAEKIREKANTNATYTIAEMPSGIDAVYAAGQVAGGSVGGGIIPTGEINITENGTYDVTNYASALVAITSAGGSSVHCGTVSIGNKAEGTNEQVSVATTYEVDIGAIADVRSISLFYAGENQPSPSNGWHFGWYGNNAFNASYKTAAGAWEKVSVFSETAANLYYDQNNGKLYAKVGAWTNVICGKYFWVAITGGDL